MKVSYAEGVATHSGPESCTAVRKDRGEALTGGRTGRVSSREIDAPSRKRRVLRGADAVEDGGRQHRVRRYCESQPDPARSKTLRMYGSTLSGNREIPRPSAAEGAAE